MIVKDEANRIRQALTPIVDLASDIVIVDTGSHDETMRILSDEFNITPLQARIGDSAFPCKAAVRNFAYEHIQTPWILSLDADEVMARDDFQQLLDAPDDGAAAGYFFEWLTYKNGSVVEDYKLCLFRKGLKSTGSRHENMQVCIRDRGLQADWMPGIRIAHYPEISKDSWKQATYTASLREAIAAEPDWFRYHWFLGYSRYVQNELAEAQTWLQQAAACESTRFPVECLNAASVLTSLYAAAGDEAAVLERLETMQSFYERVRDDFEVKINHRLKPWLDSAAAAANAGRLGDIRPYAFAH